MLYNATSPAKHAMDSTMWDVTSDVYKRRRTKRNSNNIAPTWQQSHGVRRPWQVWLRNSVDDIAFLLTLALISANCVVESMLIAAVCFAHLGSLVICLAKFVTVASWAVGVGTGWWCWIRRVKEWVWRAKRIIPYGD